MSDDKSNRGAPDRDRIDVNEEYELQYWSEKFGVSRDQLKQAVAKVGPMAKEVQRQLGR